jgi:hypothetical protein
MPLLVRRRELHAVPVRERAIRLPIERDPLQPARIVRHLLAGAAGDGHQIVVRVYGLDARVFAGGERQDFAAGGVAHDVPRCILLGLDNDSYQPTLLARIAAVPGVRAASFSFVIPGIGAPLLEPVAPLGATTEASAAIASVSPGFFRVLHMPLIEGRDFAWTDNSRHPRVAILSQRLRQQFFGGGTAIGRHIQLESDGTRQDFEVIGVVADAELYDRRQATLRRVHRALAGRRRGQLESRPS